MPNTGRLPEPQRSAGRPRSFDVNEVLDKAISVFTERGYQAASISELAAATGLTAGSIYKAFGDKRGMFLAAMARYKLLGNVRRDAGIAKAATGRGRVRALLDYYAENSHGESGIRGCLIIGAAVELALFDEDAASKVSAHQQHTFQLIETSIREGRADGSIGQHIDPDQSARAMFCFMQGLRIAGKTGQDRDAVMAAADAAMKILD